MNKSIDICLSPDLVHLYDLKGKIVVVVDILRATSCITTGLAHGIMSITPYASLEECRSMKQKGYYIAGERGGRKVDGFDIGNSPYSYMEPHLKDQKIAITTTNGTIAIEKSNDAEKIIIGAFLNLAAVVNYLRTQGNDVVILCAGWKGHINLEDTMFAGALALTLESEFHYTDDAVLLAKALYKEMKGSMLHAIQNASHVKRLKKFNVNKDVEFCLTPNRYDVVPVLKNGEIVI
ncbi:MAG: 2-phosphosulfolactate phosphatase [Bacteroidetes bacterium]|nr:2-phosphosulfolactate phosphatase [Bacteroidota bacterium]